MKLTSSIAHVVSTQALRVAARRGRLLGALLAGLAIASASETFAQAVPRPPDRMTYQGYLVDGNGDALGDPAAKNYDVIFRIYSEPTGNTGLLWAEQQTITVDKGNFSVLLGEGASTGDPRPSLPSLFKGPTASERYVAITVKGIGPAGANVDIQPRLRLLTAPYAFLSEYATKLVRPDTTEDLITADGNGVIVSGTLSAGSLTAPVVNGAAINATGVTADSVTTKSLLLGQWQVVPSESQAGGTVSKFLIGAGPTLSESTPPVMALQPNGNVGIGTTSPGLRLEVNGNVGITTTNFLEFGRGLAKNADAGKIGYGIKLPNRLGIIGAGSSPTDRRVDIYSEGGLTIFGPVKSDSLTASGPVIAEGFTISPNGLVGTPRTASWEKLVNGGMRFTSVEGLSIARWVDFTGTSWVFSSDRRLKKDIEDVESLLERALRIPVRRYRWKDEDSTAKHKLGVIAQEVQPLFPDLVTESQDSRTKESTLAVAYGDFGLVAIKALQEMKARHDGEVAALKSEIATLKSQMAEVLQAATEIRGQSNGAAKAKETAATGR